MSGIAKITNFFQYYGLIAPVDPLWLLKFWTSPATSSIAVAALVQDEDALDGVMGRRKCWHRPVTGRIPRCRFNRHRSITIKELLGSLTVHLRCRVGMEDARSGICTWAIILVQPFNFL